MFGRKKLYQPTKKESIVFSTEPVQVPPASPGKFHIFKSYELDNDQWYWNLRGRNGKIIAQSEGYQRRGACVNAVNRIKEIAGNAQIVFDD